MLEITYTTKFKKQKIKLTFEDLTLLISDNAKGKTRLFNMLNFMSKLFKGTSIIIPTTFNAQFHFRVIDNNSKDDIIYEINIKPDNGKNIFSRFDTGLSCFMTIFRSRLLVISFMMGGWISGTMAIGDAEIVAAMALIQMAHPGAGQPNQGEVGCYARIVDWDSLPNGLLGITIEGGGLVLLSVEDDGHGIMPGELPLAFVPVLFFSDIIYLPPFYVIMRRLYRLAREVPSRSD